jgi:transcriptional regulator of heat shock response
MNKQQASSITERQARILAAIVKEYSESGQPVGSEEISQKYSMQISSATVRNEMAALEKMGYIEQPHTSAGRIPTDFGYRYFVNELMKRFELSLKEQKLLRGQLLSLAEEHQELGKRIAKILAQKTDQAAFALLPDQSSATGLSNILQSSNLEKSEIASVVNFFENIDEYAQQMLADSFPEQSETLIGHEHNLPQINDYSLIISKLNLPDGKRGLIGIIGPKSMRYDKNISVVEYVAKFLSGSALLVILISSFRI